MCACVCMRMCGSTGLTLCNPSNCIKKPKTCVQTEHINVGARFFTMKQTLCLKNYRGGRSVKTLLLCRSSWCDLCLWNFFADTVYIMNLNVRGPTFCLQNKKNRKTVGKSRWCVIPSKLSYTFDKGNKSKTKQRRVTSKRVVASLDLFSIIMISCKQQHKLLLLLPTHLIKETSLKQSKDVLLQNASLLL